MVYAYIACVLYCMIKLNAIFNLLVNLISWNTALAHLFVTAFLATKLRTCAVVYGYRGGVSLKAFECPIT